MSSDFTKINYYDLKWEAAKGRLPVFVGRGNELARIQRVLIKSLNHHVLITGPSGIGKTSLLFSLGASLGKTPHFAKSHIVLLNSYGLHKIGMLPPAGLVHYQEALAGLRNTILIIDNFGELIQSGPQALQNWTLLLNPLFEKGSISLILSVTLNQLALLENENSPLLTWCETIKLEVQPELDNIEIVSQALKRFNNKKPITATTETLESIITLSARFPSLGQMPKSAIGLLDEAIAEANNKQTNTAFKGVPKPILNFFYPQNAGGTQVTKETIEKIVSEKTGIPLAKLSGNEKEKLKNLKPMLEKSIIGQTEAIGSITSIIQRAKLGLRNPQKPLGTFLCLGPSGVGKTETAKLLAKELYGGSNSFLRIDMSEFGEAHSAARLVGSPAGYVGFDDGGQLTNHFKNTPYSLVLLDEIEKAHPKIFDIFLQLLDDGRLTSAKGETVDFTQSVVMATSNLAVEEILQLYNPDNKKQGYEQFIKDSIMPVLLRSFRPEFINRFDAIIIFKPLDPEDLVNIALLEINKIQERVKQHNIVFNISQEVLAEKIRQLYDPRFGARPVKRFVEQTCETLITEELLK